MRDLRDNRAGHTPWGTIAGILLILVGIIGLAMTWEAGDAFGITQIAGAASYDLSGVLIVIGVLVAWFA